MIDCVSLNRRLLYWLEVKCAAVTQIFPLVVMSVTFSPTLFSFSFSVSFAYFTLKKVKVWVTQSCPTLCNPMDCSPPGSSVHIIPSQGKNTGMGSHSLLQGIFLTQALNPGLLHCRQILYRLSYQGSPALRKTINICNTIQAYCGYRERLITGHIQF